MKRIWRYLPSEELKDCETISQEKFGTFKPTISQRFLISIAQRTFLSEGN